MVSTWVTDAHMVLLAGLHVEICKNSQVCHIWIVQIEYTCIVQIETTWIFQIEYTFVRCHNYLVARWVQCGFHLSSLPGSHVCAMWFPPLISTW